MKHGKKQRPHRSKLDGGELVRLELVAEHAQLVHLGGVVGGHGSEESVAASDCGLGRERLQQRPAANRPQ
jgi:hypothetical protein